MKKTVNALKTATPIALIAALGTVANAAPTVDGSRDAEYGSSIASQISSVIDIVTGPNFPLSASLDNSNTGGVASLGSGDFTDFPDPASPPEDVMTGIEIAISLDEIEWDETSPVKIAGFIHQGLGRDRGFISNQVFGGIGSDPMDDATKQPLGDPGENPVDLNTVPDDQFIIPNTLAGSTPTLDGSLDASYGAPLFVNTLATTGEDNTDSSPATANGSEINAVYAVQDADNIYIFVAGNIRTNPGFQEKISLFFDADPTLGQNLLDAAGQSGTAFELLNEFDDLTFDSSFTANYFLSFNGSDTSQFLDLQDIPAAAGGAFTFQEGTTGTLIQVDGSTMPSSTFPASGGATPNGGSVSVIADNSNTGGVVAASLSGAFDSDPALVDTGFEFKLTADELGIPAGASEIKVSGFVVSGDFSFLSNQVIGNLPGGSGNLGNPANAIDFSSIDGQQFVTYTLPSSFESANIDIDGTTDGESQWQQVYANDEPFGTGVGTGFGNATDGGPIDGGNGSEIDNLSLFVGNDPDNNGELTLYGFVGGNLETNFNKLVLFIDADTTPGVGQNPIRNDNDPVEFGNINNNIGGDGFMDPMSSNPGLTFDAGFEPDFLLSYGADTSTRSATGLFLPTDGGGFGGNFFNEPQPSGLSAGDPVPPASGTLQQTEGFGDNDDPSEETANGSELNNLTATVGSSAITGVNTRYLFLHLGANLQTNGTTLEIFVDEDPNRGQNTLIYDDRDDPMSPGNPNVAGDALNRLGGPFDTDNDGNDEPGFTFDNGFTADYYYTFNYSGGAWFGDFARLNGVLDDMDEGEGRFLGSYNEGTGGSGLNNFDGDSFSEAVLFRVDNSNTAGVAGADDQFGDTSDAPNVTTGIEVAIPLDDINADFTNAGDSVKVTVFINGTGHSFVSNQFIGAACTNELGEPRDVILSAIDGPQFAELVYPGADDQPMTNAAPATPDCEPDTVCPGDTDGNNVIDLNDLLTVLSNFGTMTGDGPAAGDVDPAGMPDGAVDLNDLLLVLSNFGTSCL